MDKKSYVYCQKKADNMKPVYDVMLSSQVITQVESESIHCPYYAGMVLNRLTCVYESRDK